MHAPRVCVCVWLKVLCSINALSPYSPRPHLSLFIFLSIVISYVRDLLGGKPKPRRNSPSHENYVKYLIMFSEFGFAPKSMLKELKAWEMF